MVNFIARKVLIFIPFSYKIHPDADDRHEQEGGDQLARQSLCIGCTTISAYAALYRSSF